MRSSEFQSQCCLMSLEGQLKEKGPAKRGECWGCRRLLGLEKAGAEFKILPVPSVQHRARRGLGGRQCARCGNLQCSLLSAWAEGHGGNALSSGDIEKGRNKPCSPQSPENDHGRFSRLH